MRDFDASRQAIMLISTYHARACFVLITMVLISIRRIAKSERSNFT